VRDEARRLAGAKLAQQRLEVAAAIGSDVPFFLAAAAALIEDLAGFASEPPAGEGAGG